MSTRPAAFWGTALTSVWAAACRAVESERPDALFHDSLAPALAGREGFAVLDAALPLIGGRVNSKRQGARLPCKSRMTSTTTATTKSR